MKFSIKDFFSRCDQIRRFLNKLLKQSHLLKKFLMKNFIFCVVKVFFCHLRAFLCYLVRIYHFLKCKLIERQQFEVSFHYPLLPEVCCVYLLLRGYVRAFNQRGCKVSFIRHINYLQALLCFNIIYKSGTTRSLRNEIKLSKPAKHLWLIRHTAINI